MQLGDDPYSNGYAAAIDLYSAQACPHSFWSVDWWWWHFGNYCGHQVLCTQHEAIFLQFPQD
jgi:hypothetical protein